jgi:hypothetical protein
MNRGRGIAASAAISLLLIATGLAWAGDFDLGWWTADGGGVMWASGGAFELGGTIGQPDAQAPPVMTGSGFELVGGFWAVPPCWCTSDVNHDGLRDGRDVQAFVDCLLAGGESCACADVQTDGVLNMADVAAFVSALLAGGACP